MLLGADAAIWTDGFENSHQPSGTALTAPTLQRRTGVGLTLQQLFRLFPIRPLVPLVGGGQEQMEAAPVAVGLVPPSHPHLCPLWFIYSFSLEKRAPCPAISLGRWGWQTEHRDASSGLGCSTLAAWRRHRWATSCPCCALLPPAPWPVLSPVYLPAFSPCVLTAITLLIDVPQNGLLPLSQALNPHTGISLCLECPLDTGHVSPPSWTPRISLAAISGLHGAPVGLSCKTNKEDGSWRCAALTVC